MCREHFQHSEISQLAHEIFNRVDWNWLSEDTRILPHGWTPETGSCSIGGIATAK